MGGVERDTTIELNTLQTNGLTASCDTVQKVNGTEDATGRFDAKILFRANTGCYEGWYMYSRTPNVIQYRRSECTTINAAMLPQSLTVFGFVCDSIPKFQQINTMFTQESAVTAAPPAGTETTADPAPVTDEPAETTKIPVTTVPEEPTTTGAAAITVSLLVLVAAIMVTMQWFKL